MASKRQSLEQERAEQAWKDIEQIDKNPKEELKKKYSSLARKAPAMVQSNGLGQTLAFLRAKAGRDRQGEHWLLYRHVSAWVMGEMNGEAGDLREQLLEWVIQQDTPVYRRATAETMAYMSWLKRFAEAVLPEAAGGGE